MTSREEKSGTGGKRGAIILQYQKYLDSLGPGEAGELKPTVGETTNALSRRLRKAAGLTSHQVTIKKVGDGLLFWVEDGRKRRGRPPKVRM